MAADKADDKPQGCPADNASTAPQVSAVSAAELRIPCPGMLRVNAAAVPLGRRADRIALCGGIRTTDSGSLGGCCVFTAPRGPTASPPDVVAEHDGPRLQRCLHAACSLPGGTLLLSGGLASQQGSSTAVPQGDVCLLPPGEGGAPLSFPAAAAQRCAHTMTTLPPGTGGAAALIFGGWEWRRRGDAVEERLSNTLVTVTLHGLQGAQQQQQAWEAPAAAAADASLTMEVLRSTPAPAASPLVSPPCRSEAESSVAADFDATLALSVLAEASRAPQPCPAEEETGVGVGVAGPADPDTEVDAASLRTVVGDGEGLFMPSDAPGSPGRASGGGPAGPAAAPEPQPRAYHACVLIGGGRQLLAIGGVGSAEQSSDHHQQQQQGHDKPNPTPTAKRRRRRRRGLSLLDDLWTYDLQCSRWEPLTLSGWSASLGGAGIAGHSALYYDRGDAVVVVGGMRGGGCAGAAGGQPLPPVLWLDLGGCVSRAVHVAPSIGRALRAHRVHHTAVLVVPPAARHPPDTPPAPDTTKRCYTRLLLGSGLAPCRSDTAFRIVLLGGVCTAAADGSITAHVGAGLLETPLGRSVSTAPTSCAPNVICDFSVGGSAARPGSTVCRRLYHAQLASAVASETRVVSEARQRARSDRGGGMVPPRALPSLAARLLQHVFLASVRHLVHGGRVRCFPEEPPARHPLRASGAAAWRAQYGIASTGGPAAHRSSAWLRSLETAGGMQPEAFSARFGQSMRTEGAAMSAQLQVLAECVEGGAADARHFDASLLGQIRGIREMGALQIYRDAVALLQQASRLWRSYIDDGGDVGKRTPSEASANASDCSGGSALPEARLRYAVLQGMLAGVVDSSVAQRMYYTASLRRGELLAQARRRAKDAAPQPRQRRVARGVVMATVVRLHNKGRTTGRVKRGAVAAAVPRLPSPEMLRAFEEAFAHRFYYMPVDAQHKFRNLLQMCYDSYPEDGSRGVLSLLHTRVMLTSARKALQATVGTILYCPRHYPVIPCAGYPGPPEGHFRSHKHQNAEMTRLAEGRKVPDGEVLMNALKAVVSHASADMRKARRTLTDDGYRDYGQAKLDPFTTYEVSCTLKKLSQTVEVDDLEPSLDFFWHQGSFLPGHPTLRDAGLMASRCAASLEGRVARKGLVSAQPPQPVFVFPSPGFVSLPAPTTVSEAVWLYAHGSPDLQKSLRQYRRPDTATSWIG